MKLTQNDKQVRDMNILKKKVLRVSELVERIQEKDFMILTKQDDDNLSEVVGILKRILDRL